nr:metallophosphoesterase family protein [Lachnospiraceae bacterium]
VMFGHTHCPLIDIRENIMVINPGSISRPRQQSRVPTYVTMEVREDGEIDYRVHEISVKGA